MGRGVGLVSEERERGRLHYDPVSWESGRGGFAPVSHCLGGEKGGGGAFGPVKGGSLAL